MILAVIVLALGLLGQTPAVAGGDEAALALRDNVVSIATEIQDENGTRTENGFGFIIGMRASRAVIVTANHVVRSKRATPDTRTKRVRIKYFGDQGRTHDAQLLETRHQELDVAVLEATFPSHLQWKRNALDNKENIRRGTKVWFIGRSGKWHVPTTEGRVNDAPLGASFNIDNLNIRPGTSGAPIVSERGILGMLVTDSAGSEARAVTIEVIEQAAKRWNLPWQLSLAESNGLDVFEEDFTPQTIPTTPPPEMQAADISGRWNFQMGAYIFGAFVPTGAGYFDITKSGLNQYRFNQYTVMGQLESTGVIRADMDAYYLTGNMQFLGQYTGTLEYLGNQLTGSVYLQGNESAIILSR